MRKKQHKGRKRLGFFDLGKISAVRTRQSRFRGSRCGWKKTGTLLLDAEYIDNYCREQSTLSMEGKMCMLNEILLAKF